MQERFSVTAAACMVMASAAPLAAQGSLLEKTVVFDRPSERVLDAKATSRRPPPKLEWRPIASVLQAKYPALKLECCRPPKQFTLTPQEPVFKPAGRGGRVSLLYYETEQGYGLWNTFGETGIWRISGKRHRLVISLEALKPHHIYALDVRYFAVGPKTVEVSQSTQSQPVSLDGGRGDVSEGHFLVVVHTDQHGLATVVLSNIHSGTRLDVYDIVVSEVAPAP